MVLKTLSGAAILCVVALLAMPVSANPPLMSEDTATPNDWEYGSITTGAGSGSLGWATKLTGNYANNQCAGVQNTVPIPGAVIVANPVLELTHGYNFEKSTFGTTYDAGVLVISKDGGVTWSHLASPGYNSFSYSTGFGLQNCLLTKYGIGQGMGLYSGIVALHEETIPLTTVGPTDLVVIKFLAASDNSVLRDGWAITSLTVAGLPLVFS